jgi:hypothetical protein
VFKIPEDVRAVTLEK